jgi:hypothetical protein
VNLEQPVLLGRGERRMAHDDRADDRLPRGVAPRRAGVDFVLEDFLVVDLLDQDGGVILAAPDGGRPAARAPRLAIERQHRQQRSHDRVVRRRRHGQLQDVAIVQQLGTLDDGEVGGVDGQAVQQQHVRRDGELHHAAGTRVRGRGDKALDRHGDRWMFRRIEAPAPHADGQRAGHSDGESRRVGR